MKTKHKISKIMGFLAIASLVMTLTLGLTATVAAQGVEQAVTDVAAMGALGFFIFLIAAIFVWAMFAKNEQYGGVAKASSVVLVLVGLAIWGGVFLVQPAVVTPTAVTPLFAVTVNNANNTTHSTAGIAAMTWNVLWDISDAAISTGDQLTMNFTVYRNDQLATFFYTNARVDGDSINVHTQNDGTSAAVIALTGGNYRTTWTDSGGNALANVLEIPSVPQAETTRETITIAVTLSDAGIAGMVDNSLSVDTFNIVFAETTTNSANQPISTTPITIPVTLLVTTQA